MDEEIIQRDNSKQVLMEWLQGDKNFSKPFSPTKAREIIRNDPLIAASLETESNKILEGGWGIKKKGVEDSYQVKKFRKDYKFDNLLQTLTMDLRWQDGLIEIARKRSKVSDLNLLDPQVIEVRAKPNGDPLYYYQESPTENVDEQVIIKWMPKNVVHIKFKDSILNFWGESDLKTAYDTVLIKDYIRKFLSWVFGTNQFRNHVNFKSIASEEQVRRFVSFYKEGERSYGKPVITDGEVTIEAMRTMQDLNLMVDILEWCDHQLMMLLQQTAISLGSGGSSGRSEGDSLSETQRTSIKAIQRKLYNTINFELFPKMSINSDLEFYWKPIDRMTEKSVFEVVEIMKRSMFSDDAIKEFMNNQGIAFDTDSIFKEPEELESNSEGEQPTPEQRSKKDASASRTRKGEDESSERIGTGEEGTSREEQITKRSGYPYHYDVVVDE